MSLLVTYEVRVHVKNYWRIEAIFDDKVLAVDAAKRFQSRNGKLPIVVVEESYDGKDGRCLEKIVFRSDYFGDAIKVEPRRRKALKNNSGDQIGGSLVKTPLISGYQIRQIAMYLMLVLAIAAYFGLQYLK